MSADCWIDVILFPLDVPPERLRALGSSLSADEGSRAGRFQFVRDRDRFIAARGMLRELLAERIPARPDSLQFGYGAHGKPFLVSSTGARTLEFNLSHADGMAALAVTPGRRVGVDIERVRAGLDPLEIGNEVFTVQESSFIRGLPPEERTSAFFAIWTRKEALMKARGRGFSLDPSCFDVLGAPGHVLGAPGHVRSAPGHVRSAPGRPPRPAAGSGEDPAELQRWVLHDIPSSPGFSAAFAVEGRSVRLSRVGETVFRGWIE